MDKKIVHYRRQEGDYLIREGVCAYVLTLDHPDCSNTKLVKTSKVLKSDETTGIFETLNSIYKPAEIKLDTAEQMASVTETGKAIMQEYVRDPIMGAFLKGAVDLPAPSKCIPGYDEPLSMTERLKHPIHKDSE